MTGKELLNKLQSMSPEKLEREVTFYYEDQRGGDHTFDVDEASTNDTDIVLRTYSNTSRIN